MILYLFTKLGNAEAIKREGLRARLTVESVALVGNGLPIVFLSDTPTCAETDANVKIYRQRHPDIPVISKRWLASYTDAPLARFTIRIPSSDYKLKRYGRWYRANCQCVDDLPPPDFMLSDVLMRRALKSWWFYFDDIPPSMIVACTIEPAIPLAYPAPASRPAKPSKGKGCSKLDAANDRFVQIAQDLAIFNPHLSITLTWGGRKEVAIKAANPTWQKWRPTDPMVAHWYNAERFIRLVSATVKHDRDHGRETLVSKFIADFRGMARSGARTAVLDAIDAHRMSMATLFEEKRHGDLLAILKEATKPSKPDELGKIGRDHLADSFATYGARMESFKYHKIDGTAGGVPWLLETAFAWCPNFKEGRVLVTGCNWTPSLGETFDGLDAELAELWVRDRDPVMVAVHLVYPAATFTDKGKTELALPFAIADAVTDAVTKITAVWTKQRKAEERNHAALARREMKLARQGRVSLKDAAAEVMEEAYLAASADGTLPPTRGRSCIARAAPSKTQRASHLLLTISRRPCCQTSSTRTQT